MIEEPEYKTHSVSEKFGKRCYEIAEAYRDGMSNMSIEKVTELGDMLNDLFLEIEGSCEFLDELSDGDRVLLNSIFIMWRDIKEIQKRITDCNNCYYDHWEFLMDVSNSKCIVDGKAKEISKSYWSVE